ncbi:unnamed protein product [Porites lobata]|uniref:EGF-like domain-containing protein n=1 Tax=Porites lobata TaxID=104759 RepID=A0ABN8S8V1_9CNID|nr:unnamed protein product [Porites lobata]
MEVLVCSTKKTEAFACSCNLQWSGGKCELDIDECAKNTHYCGANAYCNNTKGGYNCTCHPGYYGDGKNCEPGEMADFMNTIIFDSKPISVLCHIGDFGCGDGGWTPVIKMDGNKQTFEYNSSFWSNKETFNLDGGKSGFDSQETKLPSYWNTSFSKICLGMKIGQQPVKFFCHQQEGELLVLFDR